MSLNQIESIANYRAVVMSYLSTADKTSLDHPLSVNETTQIHSPPKKKLRLSLKGQKQILLGANCSLPKGKYFKCF